MTMMMMMIVLVVVVVVFVSLLRNRNVVLAYIHSPGCIPFWVLFSFVWERFKLDCEHCLWGRQHLRANKSIPGFIAKLLSWRWNYIVSFFSYFHSLRLALAVRVNVRMKRQCVRFEWHAEWVNDEVLNSTCGMSWFVCDARCARIVEFCVILDVAWRREGVRSFEISFVFV